jgi:CRP/FNR family transcriptional regulator, cyclic AMP receptor protein
MSMLSNLDLIRRVPLFSMLTADQAQAIADSVVKRRFRRGELVVEQGRKSNALFILLNGRARVLTSDSARPRGHPGGAGVRATTSAR